jgi:hypothetical protein
MGGVAELTGMGLPGTIDFDLVTTPSYCGGTCYAWRAGDGTDFFGFDNTYSGSALNDAVFNSAAWGTGYVFGVYFGGAGDLNALFGPGDAGNFYSYDEPVALTAAPELSTWAMTLLGFAGLGFAGYRRAKNDRAAFVVV